MKGLSLRQLEVYKINLENQLSQFIQQKTQKEKQILMAKGAIMWVSQRIDEIKEEKHGSQKGSSNS